MFHRRFAATSILGAAILVPAVAASAVPTLTGAVVTSRDASGSYSGSIWNTLGLDGWYNLSVISGPAGGAFLNSTDSNPEARISVPLTPGTHLFTMHGEPGSFDALNVIDLSFEGDDNNPSISALGVQDSFSFGVNPTSGSSMTLEGTQTLSANSLSFVSGAYTVTLTQFGWFSPGMEFPTSNRVDAYDTAPFGTNDFMGQFTLVVTGPAAPEPASFAMLMLGSAALLRRRR
jgi:hypothetical protein